MRKEGFSFFPAEDIRGFYFLLALGQFKFSELPIGPPKDFLQLKFAHDL